MKDAGCRLTPLGVMLLALLREGDMHPYEMIRLMRQRHRDRLVPVTNGTVYHTVGRLARAQLLTEVGTDRAGNRPERTTYALTPAGRDAVAGWVRAELGRIDHPGEFRVALAEAHNIPREDVVGLLTARRAALAAEHANHRDRLADARRREVPEQYLIETDRQTTLLDADLRWTEQLLARVQGAELEWGPPATPVPDAGAAHREEAHR